jgi:TPP-dependent pyruvate/acetoin dehydrogenase alpha subunit
MKANIPKADLAEMYARMTRIRAFEDATKDLHSKGQIMGPVHTSHGQEAEIVGACMALRLDDYMVGNHRSHGHPIGKGANVRGLMAELLGKSTGVCGGKGGSMHLADFSVGSLGETSIVGSGIPVAAGAALGAKMQGLDRVSLCFFGDGATSEGAFHEGVNMAAVWHLPVIFLCENNGYGITTPLSHVTLVTDIATKAVAYGIPGIIVDGQDVLAVYDAVQTAVQRARRGEGPTLVEAKTYRYEEHSVGMGRDFGYRSDEEIAEWRKRDPLHLFRTRLVDEFGFAGDELEKLEKAAADAVEDAIAFAQRSPAPLPHTAFTDVFA